MPQEIPPWRDCSKALMLIRKSTLGKSSKKSFESKSELDELFEGADGPDKSGAGTLSYKEVDRCLVLEMKDRTKLKNSDNLVVESVSEAIRRGFNATKNLVPGEGRPDQLEREEFRVLLIYLVRADAGHGARLAREQPDSATLAAPRLASPRLTSSRSPPPRPVLPWHATSVLRWPHHHWPSG
jgi:hypothetical protein